MKSYEIEFVRTSYLTCVFKAEDEEAAKDAAWAWLERTASRDDCHTEINYCEELK